MDDISFPSKHSLLAGLGLNPPVPVHGHDQTLSLRGVLLVLRNRFKTNLRFLLFFRQEQFAKTPPLRFRVDVSVPVHGVPHFRLV